jgi:hypothetical protein
MKDIFYIGVFVFAVWRLYIDFNKIEGFKIEKTLHVFFIAFLFSSNSWEFRIFFNAIRNYDTFSEWSTLVLLDYIPLAVTFVIHVMGRISGMILYVMSFALLARADFARKIVVWTIPFFILLDLPTAHYIYLFEIHTEYRIQNLWIFFSFNAILAIIGFLYNSKMMKKFFSAGKNSGTIQSPS